MTIRIFHDPGHGGKNTGAQIDGVVEKHLNLAISQDVEAFLSGWPYITQMHSRITDDYSSYTSRGERARAWKADLVICYHCNTMPTRPEVSGLTAFVQPDDNFAYEAALQILRAAPSGLRYSQGTPFVTEKLHLQRNSWKTAANNVMKAYAPIPTILIPKVFVPITVTAWKGWPMGRPSRNAGASGPKLYPLTIRPGR